MSGYKYPGCPPGYLTWPGYPGGRGAVTQTGHRASASQLELSGPILFPKLPSSWDPQHNERHLLPDPCTHPSPQEDKLEPGPREELSPRGGLLPKNNELPVAR